MTKLFVLECQVAGKGFYLSPDGGSTMKPKWAEKFLTKEHAVACKNANSALHYFEPVEIEFEDLDQELQPRMEG